MATPDGKRAGGTEREIPQSEQDGALKRFSNALGAAVESFRSSFFGPGAPPAPTAQTEVHGRRFDYPYAVNTLVATPRAEQGENQIDFATLRRLADPAQGGLDLLRLAIETRKDQMAGQRWKIKSRDEALQDGGERARALEKALRRPDGMTTWGTWQRMLLEDAFVLDALCVYLRRTKAKPALPAIEPPKPLGTPALPAGVAGPREPSPMRPPGGVGQPALPPGEGGPPDIGGEWDDGEPGEAGARGAPEPGEAGAERAPAPGERGQEEAAAPAQGGARAEAPPPGTEDDRLVAQQQAEEAERRRFQQKAAGTLDDLVKATNADLQKLAFGQRRRPEDDPAAREAGQTAGPTAGRPDDQPPGDREARVRDPERGTEPEAEQAGGLPPSEQGQDQRQGRAGAGEGGVPGADGATAAGPEGGEKGPPVPGLGARPAVDNRGDPVIGPDGKPVLEQAEPWKPWKPFTAKDAGCLMEPLDAASIKRLLSEDGRTPLTPDPAYLQQIKGMAATYYTSEELVYAARNQRTNRIYGYSPVEQVLTTVSIALRRQLSQMEYYTAGNVPDMIIGVPETWTPDQIAQFQAWWDSILSGNTAERRRARFVPNGTNPFPINPERVKDEWDDWLARIICYAFSLPYEALVRTVNRATAETSKEASLEQGLEPLKLWWKEVMDELIEKAFDAPDLEFVYEDEEISDAATKAMVWKTATGGKAWAKPSEARAAYGLPPDPAIDTQPDPNAMGGMPGFPGGNMQPGEPGGPGEDGQEPDAAQGEPQKGPVPPGLKPFVAAKPQPPPPGARPNPFAKKVMDADDVQKAVERALVKMAPSPRRTVLSRTHEK